MSNQCRLLLGIVCTFLLGACGSAPPLPAALAKYERAMISASEHYQAGDLPAARNAARLAVRAAELDDAGHLRAQALLSAGAISALLDDVQQARSDYAEGLREALHANIPAAANTARLGLADLTRSGGDPAGALSLYRQFLASGALDAVQSLQARNGMALALAATGELGQGLTLLQQTLPQAREHSAALHSATLSNLAALWLQDGQLPQALACALEALALDRSAHLPPAIAASHLRLANIYAAQKQWALAHDAADRAQRIFQSTGQSVALSKLQAMRARWPL